MYNENTKFRDQSYDFIKGQLNDLSLYNMECADSFKKWINGFDDVEKMVFLYRGILDYRHDAYINHLLKNKELRKEWKFKKDVAKVYLKYVSEYLYSLNNLPIQ